MSIEQRRLVVGAAGSGSGKTSITLALARALKRRGLRVATAKVGPDFIDPGYLARAAGAPAYNFDPWLTGEAYVSSLAARLSASNDILLVEGVMGLFDGFAPDALEGSTGHVAKLLGAPVLLAVNARGMSRSLAAVARGFCGFEHGVDVIGVAANFVGGARHAAMLETALAAAGGPPLLGAIPRDAFPTLPERIYGLRGGLSDADLERMADAVETHIRIDQLLSLAVAKPLAGEPAGGPPKPLFRVGIPGDAAFCFHYQDDLEALIAAGIEPAPFSPLSDSSLPGDLDMLWWGGGLVEDHARELAANKGMLASVAAYAADGGAIAAFGNGCAYFAERLETTDGERHAMAGVYPGAYLAGSKLSRLGYAKMTALAGLPVASAGEQWRGHEFSYGGLAEPTGSGWERAYRSTWSDGASSEGGWARGNILLSPAYPRLCGEYGVARGVRSFLERRKGV